MVDNVTIFFRKNIKKLLKHGLIIVIINALYKFAKGENYGTN